MHITKKSFHYDSYGRESNQHKEKSTKHIGLLLKICSWQFVLGILRKLKYPSLFFIMSVFISLSLLFYCQLSISFSLFQLSLCLGTAKNLQENRGAYFDLINQNFNVDN